MKEYKNAELGLLGGRVIGTAATTANASGYFYALQFATSAIVSAQKPKEGAPEQPNLTSITQGFTAGTKIFGQYTSITLSQGKAIGYFGD